MMHLVAVILLAFHLVAYSQQICYDFINEQQKVTRDGQKNSRVDFGNAVVFSGNNFLIVGSKYDSERVARGGAAHVYTQTEGGDWTHHAKLAPSRDAAYAECASSLAADGNTLLMGCPRDSSNGLNSGMLVVYVLMENGTQWVETEVVAPKDGKPGAHFGRSVALHGNTAVVNSDTGDGCLAYIYQRTTGVWKLEGKLKGYKNKDGGYTTQHGNSFALHQNLLVVGHWYDSKVAHQAGSATVFRRMDGKWTLEAELRPSDVSHSDWFGMSVAVDNGHVVVSSHGDDVNGADGSGSAYVYRHTGAAGWQETAKLTPRNGTSGDSFGHPVAVNGDTIAAGSTGHDSSSAHNSGGVYIFRRAAKNTTEEWREAYKLLPSEEEYNAMFGYSIALRDDNRVAVGRINHEHGTGAVYLFPRVDDPFGNSSLLCEPPVPVMDEGVDYPLVLGVSIPVGVLVLVLLVVCVWCVCSKFSVEKVEDNEYVYYQIIYKDARKDPEA